MRHDNHLSDRPEWANVQEQGVAPDVEAMNGALRDGQKIAMPQYGGFRRTGRAAAEIERREILAIAFGQRLFGRFFQERLIIKADARPDTDDVIEALDVIDQS